MGARWNQTSLCINVYVCTCNRVRVRMVVRVYVCVWECVRDRRVTWSPRDFVSATWSLSANVLALVCRPKERDEDVPVHKWILEVKIEGSASFRLKHDRLRHRCIAARLKYPRVTRYTHTHTHTHSLSLSLSLSLCSAFALPFSLFPGFQAPPCIALLSIFLILGTINGVRLNELWFPLTTIYSIKRFHKFINFVLFFL